MSFEDLPKVPRIDLFEVFLVADCAIPFLERLSSWWDVGLCRLLWLLGMLRVPTLGLRMWLVMWPWFVLKILLTQQFDMKSSKVDEETWTKGCWIDEGTSAEIVEVWWGGAWCICRNSLYRMVCRLLHLQRRSKECKEENCCLESSMTVLVNLPGCTLQTDKSDLKGV